MSSDDEDFRSERTKYRHFGPKRKRLPYPSDNPEPENEQCLEVDQADDQGDHSASGSEEGFDENSQQDELQNASSDASTETQSGSESDWSEAIGHENAFEEGDENYDFDLFNEEEEDLIINQNLSDSDGSAEDSDDDDMNIDDGQNFNFDLQLLDRELDFSHSRTIRESLYLELALSIRHKQTYENLIDSFKTKNALYGSKFFPTSKTELWKALGRSRSGIQFHAYCSKCEAYINRKSRLVQNAECPDCEFSVPLSRASYFVTLSIRKQLEYFLSIPEVSNHLRYREERLKVLADAFEDILDGEAYKDIEIDGEKLVGSNNFSYSFSIDGCKPSKGSKTNIYPLFLRMNELSPQLRQKYLFLAACYVDVKEPNLTALLHPFVKEMNSLTRRGISWTRDAQLVISKFVPTCMCVDAKARAQVYNMAKHNSHFGCTYCTYYGVSSDTMRYPMFHQDLPPYEDRTHNGMKHDMIEAQMKVNRGEQNVSVRGHKGFTPLMALKYFDLQRGNAFDDLHNTYECATKYHTEIVIKDLPKLEPRMGEQIFLNTIDSRLENIKTPSRIARKPGTCPMKNRSQMHGTEWRNWLLYFGPICLHGLIAGRFIRTLEYLSYATYLLSQDVIHLDHVDMARDLTIKYLEEFDDFRLEKSRLNVHTLQHAHTSVRNWGPIWAYSTFNFESLNHRIMQNITSPKGAINQIVNRHLISFSIELAMNDDQRISPEIKNMMKEILHKRRRSNTLQVGDHSYFLGRCTLRPPTDEEQRVLQQEGYNTVQLRVFKKMIIKGVTYTTANYVKEDSKSDDSTIYTFQNTFCTIQDFVSLIPQEGETVHGLLVLEHVMVRRPTPLFPIAKQICEVHPQNVGLLHFLRIDQVRSPVVKAPLLGSLFFIPLANLNEID
ncbi:Halomucin [Frankliniella fusca]|uniref:Halomucin n=1 Tax=Frankliniella fusca TaxID=407009 RepID=A0AAE1LLU7_9NEOP|nr:Halomucin [Frankliniella fusca]